jgi:TonB-dependent SusC/RagA subfamily outer membrane receptor
MVALRPGPKKFNGRKDKQPDFEDEKQFILCNQALSRISNYKPRLMKKGLLILLGFIFIAAKGTAQQSLHDIRKKGWVTFVYRVPADTAEKYLTAGMKAVDHFLEQIPFTNFKSDSIVYDKLPAGNYLFLSVVDNELLADLYCQTKTKVYTINNQHRVQLNILDEGGKNFSNAFVWVNKESAKYNASSKTYNVVQKKPEDAIIKVALPGDTSFFQLTSQDRNYQSVFKQRWRRFKSTKVGYVITWLPNRIAIMIKKPPRYWFPKRYKNRSRAAGKGYVIFNKPKYLPTDTVKLKAYILNKKGKQYKKNVTVNLNYVKNGKLVFKELAKLKPVSNASYVYEFMIGDSLPLDTRINLSFESKKDQALLGSGFYIEDYLLDEVATYNIRSQEELYYKNDSIVFLTSAKDANGLPLMDGRVKLLLFNTDVEKFYNDRVFVPDTLWQQEKNLLIDEETKFTIPTNNFPAADLQLRAVAIFRNSNNEIQEKELAVQFNDAQNNIVVNEIGGSISAIYYEKGKQVKKQGWIMNDVIDKPVMVEFPYSAKIDPHVGKYNFFLQNEKAKKVLERSYEPESGYRVSFSRMQIKDTVGFRLYNPKNIPVFYTIFNGNKIIESASDSSEWVKWTGKIATGRTYKLKWQYYWAGEEKYFEENIVLLSKLMSTDIKGAATVYPGQADTITVSMKDYMGRPANNVNLTAVSYNAQFASKINVPEPPYIEKFRGKLNVKYDGYEAEEASYYRRFLLGEHQAWRNKFSLDTMPYYNFLFPEKYHHLVRTRIEDPLPQVAIHVVKNGVPQEIYLLYINRQPVYYNGATDQPPYSFDVYPGYAHFGIRLRDKYIEIDSFYMQPFYKHDIAFDLDSLPVRSKITKTTTELSWQERSLLEEKMLRVENNYRNNYGYVWQGDKVVFLNGNKLHVVGPFRTSEYLQFYKPGDFDFPFLFESGYRYRVSPGVVRLEKLALFPEWQKKVYLPEVIKAKWRLGDTLTSPPKIVYQTKTMPPYLEFIGYNYNVTGLSKILIDPFKDSSIVFTILHTNDTSGGYRVLGGRVTQLLGVYPGKYTVLLVTQNFNIVEATDIEITTVGTYCIRFSDTVFSRTNEFIKLLQIKQENKWKEKVERSLSFFDRRGKQDSVIYEEISTSYAGGTKTISGRIVDAKGGSPIPFASVMIKGTKVGITSDAQGQFVLRGIPENATIIIASVGYESYEIRLGTSNNLDISLRTSSASMSEVVVTAYGVQRKQRSLGYSIVSIKGDEIVSALAGKASGVSVTSSEMLNSEMIGIRGISSITGDNKPLFIVNGIPMDELPANLDTSGLLINILKGSTAVSLYGERAANGVIIINTNDFNPKTLRDQFRDYAFWKPNLFTDKNGEVKFAVTYPDNITSWQTYVVGMDKKRRMTKSSLVTKAFKPLLAQLATPQFLIEGDSAIAIGKGINYTTSAAAVKTNFTINGNRIKQEEKEIATNNSFIDELNIRAATTDTIVAQYTINTASGFSDGEQKKIPVFRKGIEEAIGNFWVFTNDTSVSFLPDKNAGSIKLYAQNNTLDVLLDEINYLKEYPFYCMEQSASKLKGLIAEKMIRQNLNQPFNGEKEMQKLLGKLQKGQLFDGSWSWWQGDNSNFAITNYVIRTLLPLRKDPLIESNIRNGLLYLQNNLSSFKRDALLNALFTMSEAGHYMEYKQYLDKIPFDSISTHQQWQIIKIKQQQKLDHEKELKIVMNKKVETMLGGLHWGSDSYYWENNNMATTAIAFQVLEKEETYKGLLNNIIQFFLERRSSGRWRNTVESAVTLETILPTILKSRNDFNTTGKLSINGVSTDKFPYSQSIVNDNKPISISKSGGGIMYFTAWQKIFNTDPEPVTDKFLITTSFEKNGKKEVYLKAGEKITMKIKMEALKDAEYVQIEIPIPAGCTYAEKKQNDWQIHKEFYKNKLVMFVEKMNKGNYYFEIELEPRYAGNYHLNPAKAELMYFPVFYGRNEMKKVEIKK